MVDKEVEDNIEENKDKVNKWVTRIEVDSDS